MACSKGAIGSDSLQKKIADMHIHTTASDGSCSPTQIAEEAAEKGLSAISISDHDTVDGVAPAMEAGRELGVKVVPGVELACYRKDVNFELLGYFVDPSNDLLVKKLRELREFRIERIRGMVENLQENGLDITYGEVLKNSDGGAIGRIHLAWTLREKGFVQTVQEAFKKYLGNRSEIYVKKKRLSLSDAVSLIEESGGVPILAHPLYGGIELINDLASNGVKGIEVYHSQHDKSDEEKYSDVAEKYGLLEVGGSDFHGKYIPDTSIGDSYVDYGIVEKLKNLSSRD